MVSTLSLAESGSCVRFGSESSSFSLKNSVLLEVSLETTLGGDLSLRTMTPLDSSEKPESCDLVE